MFGLLEEWKPILNALIAAPIAWQSPAEIAATLGRGIEETTDVLSLMDDADWLSVWDVEPGPLITLSTLAAHRLKVVLVEVGPEELPRWVPAGQSIPQPPKASNVAASEFHARQDKVLDGEPSAERASERFEGRAVRATGLRPNPATPLRIEDLPLPIMLLGVNLTPWPGPGEFTCADVCPVCAGVPLKPYMYCLGCDRWGQDEMLEKLAPRRRSARSPGSRSARSSTPNESASSVGERSPARAARSDDCRSFREEVSRNRARHNEGRNAQRIAPVEQR